MSIGKILQDKLEDEVNFIVQIGLYLSSKRIKKSFIRQEYKRRPKTNGERFYQYNIWYKVDNL